MSSAAQASYDVIVIGAGAAGLMCAALSGRRGRRVLLLERANKVGKKILMSGGGRCNFTNLHIDPDCYLSSNPHFFKSALSRYTQWHFIEQVERHGIAYHEKELGQLFCDGSSKEIVAMLVSECEAAGVRALVQCETERVEHDGQYSVHTSRGRFRAPALVVASGGLSIPKLGGSGLGYALAEQFGHTLLPQRAGLVPFTFSDSLHALCGRLAGVSLAAEVHCAARSFSNQLLFTHRGLSGPAALQVSSYWRTSEELSLDLMPEVDVRQWLARRKSDRPKAVVRTVLGEILPRKLVHELEALWWAARADQPLADWPDRALDALGERLAGWRVRPSGTEGYRTAEVTLGGVSTDAISSRTMMSSEADGLFLIGEVVDVSGHLGGFNFQWAWASGWAAAQHV